MYSWFACETVTQRVQGRRAELPAFHDLGLAGMMLHISHIYTFTFKYYRNTQQLLPPPRRMAVFGGRAHRLV